MPQNAAPAATRALVGLGSNLGDPERQVRRALGALDRIAQTRLLRRSRLFRTAPWGGVEQPAFVNAAAEIATALGPHELLAELLAIERAHGRRRDGPRWGPRALDLDLLTFGAQHLDEPGLTVPHPHIAERAFVLVPLADLDADLAIPGLGRVRELLAHVDIGACVPLEPG